MMIVNAVVHVCVLHRFLMVKCGNFALIFVEMCRSHSYVTADFFLLATDRGKNAATGSRNLLQLDPKLLFECVVNIVTVIRNGILKS